MELVERLQKLKENKKIEKQTLARIKLRKYTEALDEINKEVEMMLKCEEVSFNIDIRLSNITERLGFTEIVRGFSKSSFKITEKGLKRLEREMRKYGKK